MTFWYRIIFTFAAAGLGVGLAGCDPSSQSSTDDQKEPHYILGQNRFSARDYPGAVEAFEASLEANPHSALAHYQLAMLYSGMVSNPAAAIYHYQQYLRFDPKANNVELVNQWIYTCKQQLATDVMPLPSSPAVLQQLQQLADKNRQLQDEVDKWRAFYAGQAAMKTNPPPISGNFVPQAGTPAVTSQPAAATSKPRTHIVTAGETPAAIARKYDVNLNALMTANPGLNPKKLRVGQILNLPQP
jgi:tetratricopeptide (TPR) repeat protein